MKHTHILVCMGLGALTLFASCNEREMDLNPDSASKGQGTLILNLNASTDFGQTRAVNEDNYRNTDNYNVRLINASNENVILECKASELSSNLPKTVEIGSYRIEASYGTEKDASRDEFFMYGDATVTVKSKEEKAVTVNCTPTCGKISVAFDSSMNTYYDDYNVTFSGTQKLGKNKIDWKKNDTEPWYVGLSKAGETITYTLTLTTKADYLPQGSETNTGTATGTFTLERNKAHKLTIRPNYIPTTDGGMKLTLTIDDTTNDKEITWEVPVTWI